MEQTIFSQPFLSEVKALALQIAWRQRKEKHLQSVEVLSKKFEAELQELAQASEPWDELPDICYYAACLSLQGAHDAELTVQQEIAKRNVTLAQLEAATLAKYRLHGTQAKDFDAERKAIMTAIAAV